MKGIGILGDKSYAFALRITNYTNFYQANIMSK